MKDYRTVAPNDQIYRYCPQCTASLGEETDAVGLVTPTCKSCGWTYFPTNHLIALAVVETDHGIVLVHPPGGPPEAPASLPSGLVEYGETPEEGAVRIVSEQTGLEVELVSELTRFLQEGTPFGPVIMFGYVARVVGGSLRADGKEGPAVIYSPEAMPPIMPIRVANQRVLAAYLEHVG